MSQISVFEMLTDPADCKVNMSGCNKTGPASNLYIIQFSLKQQLAKNKCTLCLHYITLMHVKKMNFLHA